MAAKLRYFPFNFFVKLFLFLLLYQCFSGTGLHKIAVSNPQFELDKTEIERGLKP